MLGPLGLILLGIYILIWMVRIGYRMTASISDDHSSIVQICFDEMWWPLMATAWMYKCIKAEPLTVKGQ